MIQRLLFWCLLPFVIPQALRVRRTAPRFAGAKGADSGTVGEGESLSLLVFGDSIAAGVGASTFEKALVGRTAEALSISSKRCVHWRAIGQIGATSEKVAQRLTKRIKDAEYDVIVVSVGVNDITSLRRTRQWRSDLSQLLDTLHDLCPNAVIALVGIPPLWQFPLLPTPLKNILGIRALTFDADMKQISKERPYSVHIALQFVPGNHTFSEDGYHPSEETYQKMGNGIAERVLEHRQSAILV